MWPPISTWSRTSMYICGHKTNWLNKLIFIPAFYQEAHLSTAKINPWFIVWFIVWKGEYLNCKKMLHTVLLLFPLQHDQTFTHIPYEIFSHILYQIFIIHEVIYLVSYRFSSESAPVVGQKYGDINVHPKHHTKLCKFV